MIHFVVHGPRDSAGVVVVEGVHAGDALDGWVMDGDYRLAITAQEDIPLGHKLALHAIARGDTVIKYSHDIGRAIADIPAGAHLHVHNVKTKRW